MGEGVGGGETGSRYEWRGGTDRGEVWVVGRELCSPSSALTGLMAIITSYNRSLENEVKGILKFCVDFK